MIMMHICMEADRSYNDCIHIYSGIGGVGGGLVHYIVIYG